jgi:DNA-directed RNA polymerase sigma subunit (sigma70/sigma32)
MDRKEPTLEEVQRTFEETRQRIREFEEQALKKQRKPPGDDGPVSAPAARPLRC